MSLFACEALGLRTLNPNPLSLQEVTHRCVCDLCVSSACSCDNYISHLVCHCAYHQIVNSVSPHEPVLYVATAGADPTQELEDFAASVRV